MPGAQKERGRADGPPPLACSVLLNLSPQLAGSTVKFIDMPDPTCSGI